MLANIYNITILDLIGRQVYVNLFATESLQNVCTNFIDIR